MAVKNVFTIAPVFLLPTRWRRNYCAGMPPRRPDWRKQCCFADQTRVQNRAGSFLRQSNGQPLMLPRLIPFSAVEDEETQGRLSLLTAADLPDAIDPLRRRLLLSKLIQKRSPQPLGAEKALHLADALAEFLDEAYIENMPFDRLKKLVPDEFAAHWQETLAFWKSSRRPGPKF